MQGGLTSGAPAAPLLLRQVFALAAHIPIYGYTQDGEGTVKVLIFGGSGQLGSAVRARAADLDFQVAAPVTKEVDIREEKQVAYIAAAFKPDVVINCAGYTAVDRAEEDPSKAFAINASGARNVAVACAKSKARLIHLSSDYVFDGTLGRPLRESDTASPINAYGRSKLQGEEMIIQELGESALIVRTQALFGVRGNNFIHTLLSLCTQREVLKVVDDQILSPTYVGWLAEVLLDLVRLPVGGVLHAACRGGVSWFEVAEEVLRWVAPKAEGRAVARLERTSTAAVGGRAPRPLFLTLDTSTLESLLRRPVLGWREGVQEYLRQRERANQLF